MARRLLPVQPTWLILLILLTSALAVTSTAQMSPEEAQRLLEAQSAARRAAQEDAEAPAETAVAGVLRIGSWNIEWLGTPSSRRGEGENVAQSAQDMAGYILAGRLDALAVQEVRPERGNGIDADPEMESQALADALAIVSERTGDPWDHVLFPAHSGEQLTGVAWNTRKLDRVGPFRQVHEEAHDRSFDDIRSAGPRPPHGQWFRVLGQSPQGDGLTDFVLIPIHWKAGREGHNQRRRLDEARELIAGLPVAFAAEDDVIVIGDSNSADAGEAAIGAMSDAGFVPLQANGPTLPRGRSSLDRAFVTRGQPEFEHSRLIVQRPPGMAPDRFARDLSDHYMIVLSFRVMTDDD